MAKKQINPDKEKIRVAIKALEAICATAADENLGRPEKLGRIKSLAGYALMKMGKPDWNERFNEQYRFPLKDAKPGHDY